MSRVARALDSELKPGERAQVRVLGTRPEHGNPTLVTRLESWRDDAWLREYALSAKVGECSFFVLDNDAIEVRWFAGEREVPLCGHGALAVADFVQGLAEDAAPLEVRNLKGRLWLGRRGGAPYIAMARQPITPVAAFDRSRSAGALRIYDAGRDCLAVLENDRAVQEFQLSQSFARLCPKIGYVVTAASSIEEPSFRFFAPEVGIAEDRASLSAIPALISCWENAGRRDYRFRQLSGYDITIAAWTDGDRVAVAGTIHRVAA